MEEYFQFSRVPESRIQVTKKFEYEQISPMIQLELSEERLRGGLDPRAYIKRNRMES